MWRQQQQKTLFSNIYKYIYIYIYIKYISTRVSSFTTYHGTTINNEDRKEF